MFIGLRLSEARLPDNLKNGRFCDCEYIFLTMDYIEKICF